MGVQRTRQTWETLSREVGSGCSQLGYRAEGPGGIEVIATLVKLPFPSVSLMSVNMIALEAFCPRIKGHQGPRKWIHVAFSSRGWSSLQTGEVGTYFCSLTFILGKLVLLTWRLLPGINKTFIFKVIVCEKYLAFHFKTDELYKRTSKSLWKVKLNFF